MSEVYANILDSLTTGLYIQVSIALREYLQNAYDAIKAARLAGLKEPSEGYHVEIKLTKDCGIVTISDNGIGMDLQLLSEYTSIGGGTKTSVDFTGHKGIGKLAGLRFFNRFVVRTKKSGYSEAHQLAWNCGDMMKTLLSQPELMKKTPYRDFIKDYFTISSFPDDNVKDHYTQVQLVDILPEFRDQLSEEQVAKFVKSCCPVPFFPSAFDHASVISDYLGKDNLAITTHLNDGIVYLPYTNDSRLVEPQFLEIKYADALRAKVWYSWVSESAEVLSDPLLSGLKFRCKGIRVGDKNLFANNCMPEGVDARAHWFTGEVYVIDDSVRPNTARDGFEKSAATTKFYAEIKKKLGRELSALAEARSAIHAAEQSLAKIEKVKKEGGEPKVSDLKSIEDRLPDLRRHRDKYSANTPLKFDVIEKIQDLSQVREQKAAEKTVVLEQQTDVVIQKGSSKELIEKLIELKDEEANATGKTKRDISRLTDRIRQAAVKSLEKEPTIEPVRLSKEDEIVQILIDFLASKNVTATIEEVRKFVRSRLKAAR